MDYMDIYFLINGQKIEDSFVNCTKNPGHKGFIPVQNCIALKEDFIDVLPINYKNEKARIKMLIQYLSHLTVNVQSNNDGKKNSGTGFIHSVIKYSTPSGTNCLCKKCKTNPKQVEGEVHVRTANHNICDLDNSQSEIVCRLFYRSNDFITRLECSELRHRNESNDTVILVCKTCDLTQLEGLEKHLEEYKELKSKLNRMFINRTKADVIAIIVSHPHSVPQHVTVGPLNPEKKEIIFDGSFVDQYIYRTFTCEGSSGAFVCQLGGIIESEACVHIGPYEEDTRFNVGNIYKDKEDIPASEFFFQMLNN